MQDSVRNKSFREMFDRPTRFIIPFFQRGYAWEKKQWDQLFDDITDNILPEVDDGSPLADAEHFFGPIVVLEKSNNSDNISQYLVIDGQQRLTTIYLLLGMIKEKLEQLQHKSPDALNYALRLRQILANDITTKDDYDRLKVFSSKGDRLPTYRVIYGLQQKPESAFYHTDTELYQPGNNQVDAFRDYCERKFRGRFSDAQSLWQLALVLLDCLRVVWIPLEDGKDDPQAIFESLNDKGMPLSSSELICSSLFRPLEHVPDFEELHNRRWLSAMRKFDKRDTFEEYLRCLFSIGERKTVGKGRRTYVHFKNRHRNLNVPLARQRLEEIHESAMFFLNITNPQVHRHTSGDIARLLEDINATRMDSSRPFVLAILRARELQGLKHASAISLLQETLTMLVRRKMTELSTTVYDVMFPQLFGLVVNETDPVKALQDQFQKYLVWTSDQDFESALIDRTLYRSRDLPFVRMVLSEIDRGLQTHGQLPDYSTLTSIEHIIPQALTDEWRQYLGSDLSNPGLETIVNSIGNLCLLSNSANSSASQEVFERKREKYSDLTGLVRQLRQFEGTWNLEAVQSRSSALAVIAVQRWAWTQR